jgi:hypothetical protein
MPIDTSLVPTESVTEEPTGGPPLDKKISSKSSHCQSKEFAIFKLPKSAKPSLSFVSSSNNPLFSQKPKVQGMLFTFRVSDPIFQSGNSNSSSLKYGRTLRTERGNAGLKLIFKSNDQVIKVLVKNESSEKFLTFMSLAHLN